MKRLIYTIQLLIFFFIYANSFATHYYFAANGSDANNGTSIATPFKTIAKFNSFFNSFNNDDEVSFNGGDIFFGTLIPTKSFTAGHPLIIDSYGTGKAVITGFLTISTWNNLGANIWESSSSVSTLSYTNLIAVNGVNTAMGRTPNTGTYYAYQSHTSITITSSNLNSAIINYTGAELAMNIATFRIVRNKITSQSGSTLTYIPDPEGAGFQSNNQRFIIQNDIRTLDQQNEWYYNPTTKKLDIYSTSIPTGVQIPTLDSLVILTGRSNITFSNLSFIGANTNPVRIDHSPNISFLNCSFDFSGRDGILITKTGNSNGFIASNCSFNHINNNAIDIPRVDGDFATISHNSFKNCGMIYGEIDRNDGVNNNNTAQACSAAGASTIIRGNIVDSMGFMGLRFYGSNSTVDSNYITNFCFLLNDGGGIYTWNGALKGVQTGILVRNNIIASNNTSSSADYGLYFDDLSNNIEAYGNTVFNSSWGQEIHNTFKINLHDNTYYNNAKSGLIDITDSVGVVGGSPYVSGHPNNDSITFKKNIFFAQTASQMTSWYYRSKMPIGSMLPTHFISDTNNYARPIDNNGLSILTNYQAANNPPQITTNRSLPMWVTYSGVDNHSTTTPLNITNVNQLFFAYNPAFHDSTVILPAGNWVDVHGIIYNTGSLVLHAFNSIILISTGTNIPPTANAGTNKNITLPTNTVNQVGSGTDADGTIITYSWTFFSGPKIPTFGTPTASTTTINALDSLGVYVIQLKVTDNGGLTATDTMSIVVNNTTLPNQPPVVNAGGNKNITLPVSSVTQVGSATDIDGTIVSYLWQQNSGPLTAVFGSPTAATTLISGMTTAGIYSFTLIATDNSGNIGSQTITVTVNRPANIPPTAHAGSDQVLTWPTNSVTLVGSGTDTDGTIVGYSWTNISGVGTVNSPNSATTSITGLDIGISLYQLQVTDNSGAIGLDTVKITENQGIASISVTGTSTVFNTSQQGVTVTTSPLGLSTSTTYNGISTQPINVGNYNYIAAGNDYHWIFNTISGIFSITKQTVIINATDQTVNFDGLAHTITATTTPEGIPTLTYSYSSGSAPVAVGVYGDTIKLVSSNYQAAQVIVHITIVSNPAPIFISDTSFTYDGTSHCVTVTCAYSFTLTGGCRTNAGSQTVTATINDGIHTGSATATLTIAKKKGHIAISKPANVSYGTKFTSQQLNATIDIPGTITYVPTFEDQIPLGLSTITAVLTPSDPANYIGDSATTTITSFAVNPFLNFYLTNKFFLKIQ